MDRETAINHHIGGKSRTRGPDGAIAGLAGRQHGVVSRRQLLALGVGRRAIERRIEGGRLHRLHAGVYTVGHEVISQHGRWMAGVLAAGPGAVLSHRSAAALWGIRPTARARIEVTSASKLHPRTGLHLHCAVLPADETAVRDGIPVTTAARTLLDLAAVTARHELDRAPQRGRDPARRSTRSPLEAEFQAFITDHGIPSPETNIIIEGYECDAVWREAPPHQPAVIRRSRRTGP
jgi:hypothetical protein